MIEIIKITISNQSSKVELLDTIYSNNKEQYRVHFIFDTDDWNDYNKMVVFDRVKNYDTPIGINITEENSELVEIINEKEFYCVLPWEVITQAGYFNISIYGTYTNEKGEILKKNYMVPDKFTIQNGGDTTVYPRIPTPNMYEQLVNISESLKADAAEAKQMATAANKQAEALLDQTNNLNIDVQEIKMEVEKKSNNYLFDTLREFQLWIKKKTNRDLLNPCDGFYIKEEGTADYWWDGNTIKPFETLPSDIEELLVGEKTPEGGEIFNDYENNKALSGYSTAKGYNTIAGCKGFKILDIQETVAIGSIEYLIRIDNLDNINNGDKFSLYSEKLNKNFDLCGEVVYAGVGPELLNIQVKGIPEGLYPLSGKTLEYIWFPYKPNLNGDIVLGTGADASGYDTKAITTGSHTEGYNTIAGGKYAHAEGNSTFAGYASHAEGRFTQALGPDSHAEGRETVSLGEMSHSEGYKSQASGKKSHAEGAETRAKGENSHAEGYDTEAIGSNSHTEGSHTITQGNSSHAEGSWAQATADYAHAEGNNSQARGEASHAEGINTKARGRGSHASGINTIANGEAQMVIGKYNEENNTDLFIVGNGFFSDAYGDVDVSNLKFRVNIKNTETSNFLRTGNYLTIISNNCPEITSIKANRSGGTSGVAFASIFTDATVISIEETFEGSNFYAYCYTQQGLTKEMAINNKITKTFTIRNDSDDEVFVEVYYMNGWTRIGKKYDRVIPAHNNISVEFEIPCDKNGIASTKILGNNIFGVCEDGTAYIKNTNIYNDYSIINSKLLKEYVATNAKSQWDDACRLLFTEAEYTYDNNITSEGGDVYINNHQANNQGSNGYITIGGAYHQSTGESKIVLNHKNIYCYSMGTGSEILLSDYGLNLYCDNHFWEYDLEKMNGGTPSIQFQCFYYDDNYNSITQATNIGIMGITHNGKFVTWERIFEAVEKIENLIDVSINGQ